MREKFHFHDTPLTLEVSGLDINRLPYLSELLTDFWWDPYDGPLPPQLHIEISTDFPPCPFIQSIASPSHSVKMKRGVSLTFSESKALIQLGETHGQVDFHHGRCQIFLDSGFFERSPNQRSEFWMPVLISLLQSRETFMMHAAGLVSPAGEGVIFVATSGSGKSTLTLGLIREGWSYLSDDVLFLRILDSTVEAFAGRRTFYVVGERVDCYRDWPLGEDNCPDRDGNARQEILVRQRFPDQFLSDCHPRVLVLPQIVRQPTSQLIRLDRGAAIKDLLRESSIGLTGQQILPGQLAVISRLVGQCQVYRLESGEDLHHHPELFANLLDNQSVST